MSQLLSCSPAGRSVGRPANWRRLSSAPRPPARFGLCQERRPYGVVALPLPLAPLSRRRRRRRRRNSTRSPPPRQSARSNAAAQQVRPVCGASIAITQQASRARSLSVHRRQIVTRLVCRAIGNNVTRARRARRLIVVIQQLHWTKITLARLASSPTSAGPNVTVSLWHRKGASSGAPLEVGRARAGARFWPAPFPRPTRLLSGARLAARLQCDQIAHNNNGRRHTELGCERVKKKEERRHLSVRPSERVRCAEQQELAASFDHLFSCLSVCLLVQNKCPIARSRVLDKRAGSGALGPKRPLAAHLFRANFTFSKISTMKSTRLPLSARNTCWPSLSPIRRLQRRPSARAPEAKPRGAPPVQRPRPAESGREPVD